MQNWKKRLGMVGALSPASVEIIALIEDDDDRSLQKLIAAIESDPVLSAGILKLANSASFGFSHEVVDIRRAVNLTGFAAVSEMALSLAVSPLCNRGDRNLAEQLWQHSITTACIARELCTYSLVLVIPGMAYTAGLLHDIGKAVLFEDYNSRSAEIHAILKKNKSDDFVLAEYEVFGISHVTAGAMLLTSWNVPNIFKESIQWHHEPSFSDERARSVSRVVHIADLLAMWSGYGTDFDCGCYEAEPDAFAAFNIASPRLERLLQAALVRAGNMV